MLRCTHLCIEHVNIPADQAAGTLRKRDGMGHRARGAPIGTECYYDPVHRIRPTAIKDRVTALSDGIAIPALPVRDGGGD
eukprot:11034481-Alexandrium_andersonii.AAC.1